MYVVGLTGGIASGKTTISEYFHSLGVPVIDTDIISRQLLEPGEPGYQRVLDRYGKRLLTHTDEIDRAQLRRLVFSQDDEKRWLESILHPMIYASTSCQIDGLVPGSYALVVIPLLFETDFKDLVDRILVVDCSAETQISRLMARDGIDRALALAMLEQQWKNEQRLELADDIIHNDGKHSLFTQIDNLHQKYLLMAA